MDGTAELPAAQTRVVVVASTQLVGDALQLALAGRSGLDIVAVTCAPAPARAAISETRCDVVLLHWSLPEGAEILRAFLDRRDGPPIIACSFGRGADSDVVQWAEAGAKGCLSATDPLDIVGETILRAARGEVTCSGSLAGDLFTKVRSTTARLAEGQPIHDLTRRERQILELIGQGLSNKEIASSLHLQVATVKNHAHNTFRKLGVTCRAQAASVLARSATDALSAASSLGTHSSPEPGERSGVVVWFTGLPGAGKTTLGTLVHAELSAAGVPAELLDGDEIRSALSPTLGFSRQEREAHNARLAWLAARIARRGVHVIVTAISPYATGRTAARDATEPRTRFLEVFVATPLDECVRRDPKGLYRKAIAGEIADFTGISAPYEEPQAPDIRVETVGVSPRASAAAILEHLRQIPVSPHGGKAGDCVRLM